jgi:hypothetical protein
MRGKIIRTLAGAAVGALIVLLLRPSGLSRPTASPAPTAAELALERTLPEVRFEFVPFDEAVQTLQRLSGTPINVDWPALKAAGFSPTSLVKLRGPE